MARLAVRNRARKRVEINSSSHCLSLILIVNSSTSRRQDQHRFRSLHDRRVRSVHCWWRWRCRIGPDSQYVIKGGSGTIRQSQGGQESDSDHYKRKRGCHQDRKNRLPVFDSHDATLIMNGDGTLIINTNCITIKSQKLPAMFMGDISNCHTNFGWSFSHPQDRQDAGLVRLLLDGRQVLSTVRMRESGSLLLCRCHAVRPNSRGLRRLGSASVSRSIALRAL